MFAVIGKHFRPICGSHDSLHTDENVITEMAGLEGCKGLQRPSGYHDPLRFGTSESSRCIVLRYPQRKNR